MNYICPDKIFLVKFSSTKQHSFNPLHNKPFRFKKALLVTLHFKTEGYLHHTLVPQHSMPGCHANVRPKKYAVLMKNGIIFSLDAVNYDMSISLLPEATVRIVLQLPLHEHKIYNGEEIKDSC